MNLLSDSSTYTSTGTGESFKVNHRICCNDKSLIFLLTCKVCKKKYTGKTVGTFRLRWNNYKENDRRSLRCEEIKQKSLHDYFLREGHQSFEEDVNI